MEFVFYLLSEITDTDILDNINDECIGIFLYKESCWFEVRKPLENNDNKVFFVDDGWVGTKTNDIIEAMYLTKKFYNDNQ
jgi:hypothetical protein